VLFQATSLVAPGVLELEHMKYLNWLGLLTYMSHLIWMLEIWSKEWFIK